MTDSKNLPNQFPSSSNPSAGLSSTKQVCPHCGQLCKNTHGLHCHLSKSHRAIWYPEHLQHRTCSFCNKVFDTPYHLSTHITIHSSTRPFVCSECGRSYKSEPSLQLHVRRVHERAFPCPYCDLAFGSASRLQRHLSTHTHQWHICPQCGKRIKRNHNYQAHLEYCQRIHRNQKAYHCQFCNKSFELLRLYRIHLFSVHPHQAIAELGLQPRFSCPYCNRIFYYRTRYTRHLNRHLVLENAYYHHWELLVRELARILFASQLQEIQFEPTIPTPSESLQSCIIPDVVIYTTSGETFFIEAKLSPAALNEKDYKIYPKYCDKLLFWCLFDSTYRIARETSTLHYEFSDALLLRLPSELLKGYYEVLITQLRIKVRRSSP